ncbi:hypothetical protein C8F04DRAFT_1173799 [Mycena alexandri]|uniref:Uncharacterized protein n=1 Tax=Mycena alexandri TaxID=1745969 RepID=A0AAD6TFW5_9AGAR|nr:hypothetical protein C8F04DRAFT_1173799 [Mycena alexandri]
MYGDSEVHTIWGFQLLEPLGHPKACQESQKVTYTAGLKTQAGSTKQILAAKISHHWGVFSFKFSVGQRRRKGHIPSCNNKDKGTSSPPQLRPLPWQLETTERTQIFQCSRQRIHLYSNFSWITHGPRLPKSLNPGSFCAGRNLKAPLSFVAACRVLRNEFPGDVQSPRSEGRFHRSIFFLLDPAVITKWCPSSVFSNQHRCSFGNLEELGRSLMTGLPVTQFTIGKKKDPVGLSCIYFFRIGGNDFNREKPAEISENVVWLLAGINDGDAELLRLSSGWKF